MGFIRARDLRASAIAAAAAAGDPYFANVVLLLDFAGADDATDITDLSNSAHTETFNLDAKVDTSEQYLGVNSLECATQGYVTYPDHADWDFPGDFTIELGMKRPGAETSRGVIGNYAATTGWAFQIGDPPVSDVDLNFIAMGSQIMTREVTISSGQFYHVAWCRDGSDLRLFVDGVQQGIAVTYATSITSPDKLLLGLLAQPATQLFKGWIGAVRITKGVARYTANFTPPSVFYPTE